MLNDGDNDGNDSEALALLEPAGDADTPTAAADPSKLSFPFPGMLKIERKNRKEASKQLPPRS
jgi:hypothetical protein